MIEPRTAREARLAIRKAERAVDQVRMSPACGSTGWSPGAWYLRQAQAALRQAERAFARADDPRLEYLKPLSPQVERRPLDRPRRRRYRCNRCFTERLLGEVDLAYNDGIHPGNGLDPSCGGQWELVPPLRRKAKR